MAKLAKRTPVQEAWTKCHTTIEFLKDISYLVISDIHFFDQNTPTQHIADNIVEFFSDFLPKSRFTTLDVIFIAGDIFEDILYYRHPDVLVVQALFRRLMAFCKTYGIKLRILEGTPSHDHFQAANFQSLADAFGPELDYKYIKSLHLERMTDLNLSVLYIPDEWAGSAEKCAKQVEELYEAEGIERADIGIFHGMFEYQIPKIANHPLTHSSAYYLERVKYFINIGHIHTASVFDRILAQGSFDRTAHGQEEKKGAILVKLRLSGNHSFEFIENPRALIYKTIRLEDSDDIDTCAAKIRVGIEKLPDGSHVRIMATKTHPMLAGIAELKKAYPTLHIKKEGEDGKKLSQIDQLAQIIDLDTEYVPISIFKDNLIPMTLEEMEKTAHLTPDEHALLVSELEALHI